MKPYAEVIGDPVSHSRSPAIHRAWLAAGGIEAAYRAVRITADELPEFFRDRRADPLWRGCNVTAPLKQAAIPFLDRVDRPAQAIGAVNCVVPEDGKAIGYNTDIDGVLAALQGRELHRRTVALIGSGGAARAGVAALRQLGAQARIIARDASKASTLSDGDVYPLDAANEAFDGAHTVINASTLGMAGAAPMPPHLLAALDRLAPDATVFDMVYHPQDTALLGAARERGLHVIGGLVMLEAQARRAFQLFFGGLRRRPGS